MIILITTKLKLVYEEYAREQLLKPFINTDRKVFYPFKVIDLSFQIDQVLPKKIQQSKNVEKVRIMFISMLDYLLY